LLLRRTARQQRLLRMRGRSGRDGATAQRARREQRLPADPGRILAAPGYSAVSLARSVHRSPAHDRPVPSLRIAKRARSGPSGPQLRDRGPGGIPVHMVAGGAGPGEEPRGLDTIADAKSIDAVDACQANGGCFPEIDTNAFLFFQVLGPGMSPQGPA